MAMQVSEFLRSYEVQAKLNRHPIIDTFYFLLNECVENGYALMAKALEIDVYLLGKFWIS